jgi:hypothetical protein
MHEIISALTHLTGWGVVALTPFGVGYACKHAAGLVKVWRED